MKVSHSTRALIGAVALCLLTTGALAQGVVDQENDPTASSGFGCGNDVILNGTILQSFVPAAGNLVAVELRLMAGSAFPTAGTTTTARIREGTSSGTILGTASTSVAGPIAAGTKFLVRFDFTQIALTAGNTYLIEWVTPPTTELLWVGSGGDPYPAGTAHSCSGNPWPIAGTDFNFVTYEAEAAPEPTETDAPSCDSLFEQLRTAVADLELRRFKQRALDKLLDNTAKHLEGGKTKAVKGNILALANCIRVLERFGVISEEEAATVLGLAESLLDCLGVETRHGNWWEKYKGKRKHGDDDGRDHDD